MRKRFNQVADWVTRALGSPFALLGAALVIVVWAVTGPLFGFSDTWQLVINTGTTIVTFLMVFVIQNSQNRDSKAVHIKLDELIRAMEGASNKIALAELETEEEQDAQIARMIKLARKASGKTKQADQSADQAEKAEREAQGAAGEAEEAAEEAEGAAHEAKSRSARPSGSRRTGRRKQPA